MTTTQQVQALVSVSAQAMIAALAINTMGNFMAYGVAAKGAGTMAGGELEEINEKLRKLSYVLERYRSSVVSLRNRRTALMKQYGLTVTPPTAELRKYPQLGATENNLRIAEQQLARLEIRNINLRKRKKELEQGLGVRAQEPEKHVQYTQMKKFTPKTGIY